MPEVSDPALGAYQRALFPPSVQRCGDEFRYQRVAKNAALMMNSMKDRSFVLLGLRRPPTLLL
jgi:hypothetical protein